ncbi:hypothetical protein [Rhizobium sp. SG2393]|uniref:hypothetical protein n=1 Tax=Rhizobium sp. SG2393 TaxID=3276279 RepID=UPI00366BE01F
MEWIFIGVFAGVALLVAIFRKSGSPGDGGGIFGSDGHDGDGGHGDGDGGGH